MRARGPKSLRLAAAAAVWLLSALTTPALAAEHYVDAARGDDSAQGTSAQPWRTLARMQAELRPGDVINLTGTFREGIKVTHASGCVFRQWPGREPAVLRGDTVVPWDAWSLVSPGVFECTIPEGTLEALTEAVVAVVVDWDQSVDAQGRHFGHLRRVGGIGDVEAWSDSWALWRNGAGGGVLRIGIEEWHDTLDSLRQHTIAYCRGNVNGIELGTPTYDPYPAWGLYTGQDVEGAVVDGLRLYLWADGGVRAHVDHENGEGEDSVNPPGTRSIGYGVRIADGVGCTIRNVVTIDAGYHGLGFVGDACRDNLFENCEVWGGGVNPLSGNSSYVFYSGPGLGMSDIAGCRGVRCAAYKYTFLGRDGAPIAPGAGCYGMIAHTNAIAGNVVRDVEWRDCDVFESGDPVTSAGCVGGAFVGGSLESDEVDPLDWRTYPVRYVNCRVWNGAENLTSFNGHCAYVNCRFDMRRAGRFGHAGVGHLGCADGTAMTLFSGCEIVADLDRDDAGEAYLFSGSWGNWVLLVNSSVYIVGSASAPASEKAIFVMAGDAQWPIVARGSVFGYASRSSSAQRAHRLVLGVPHVYGPVDAPATNRFYFDFKDCAYFNLDAYGTTPGVDEEAEWTTGFGGHGSNGSAIDPDGLCLDTANPYADKLGGSLRPTGWFAGATKNLAVHAAMGFNGRGYDGRYGAWQFGAEAGPVVVVPPRSVIARPGGAARLRVTASGRGGLSYEWRRDGAPVSGANVLGQGDEELTIDPVGARDIGPYDVVVSDAYGSTASAVALLRCAVDLDGNGFVNGDDYDGFVAAFVTGEAGADIDGNGFVNGEDFDAFTEAFERGC